MRALYSFISMNPLQTHYQSYMGKLTDLRSLYAVEDARLVLGSQGRDAGLIWKIAIER